MITQICRHASALVIALGVGTTPLIAQKFTSPEEVWLSGIGLSLHGALISHKGDFTLPNAPTCCVGYTDASSFGVSVGAFFRQEITKHARLTLRGSYIPFDGTFNTSESLLLSGQVPGVVDHELETRIGVLAGEALVDVRLPARIRVMGGLSFGSFMSSTFSQSETLVEPVAGTFENGRRVRNEQNNVEMSGLAGAVMGLVGGIGMDLPLTVNHSVVLTPELLYTHPLGDNLENGSWTTSVIRAGVSLAFNLNAPAPPIPVERRRETFVDSLIVDVAPDAAYRRTAGIERVDVDTVSGEDLIVITERAYRTDTVYAPLLPTVDAAIAARAVMADGSMRNTFTINVSTQFVTEALPVLPVVFFDSRDMAVASRYRQIRDRAQYDEAKISPRTTDVHREILNIIGKRMADNPSVIVRLRGHADPSTESGDCELARKRAESVKTYLTTTWGIAADRITNVTGSGNCAPEKLTRQQSEEGYSENRRVEIESDDLSILAPVGRRRFNEARAVDPPKILFDPSGTSTKYITSWKLEAKSGGITLFSKDGQGTPTSVVQDLTITQAEMMKDGEPVKVDLTVQAIRGVSKSATTTLAVQRDTLATEYERLTLTLFDVASDKVTPIAEEQIRKFVEAVPAGSVVSVRGFADMLGNATFNRELSQRRATAVCATIQKYLKKRVSLKCDEVRTDRFPPGIESYMTPEERFLSRTVQIEVKRSR